jgi:hypothetical protein
MAVEDYMDRGMTPEKNDATVLVRLPTELKNALQREAFIHGRRITAEINMRLANSLKANSYPDAVAAPKIVSEAAPARPSDIEKELLAAFRKLSPQKQLALLSLLK